MRPDEWLLIGRRARAEAVLADAGEISDLLGADYRLGPKAAFAEQGAELWLPEVGTHVVGATLEDARRELAEAMIGFASDWEERLRHTADQSLKAGNVRRIQLAGDQTGVLALRPRRRPARKTEQRGGGAHAPPPRCSFV